MIYLFRSIYRLSTIVPLNADPLIKKMLNIREKKFINFFEIPSGFPAYCEQAFYCIYTTRVYSDFNKENM